MFLFFEKQPSSKLSVNSVRHQTLFQRYISTTGLVFVNTMLPEQVCVLCEKDKPVLKITLKINVYAYTSQKVGHYILMIPLTQHIGQI